MFREPSRRYCSHRLVQLPRLVHTQSRQGVGAQAGVRCRDTITRERKIHRRQKAWRASSPMLNSKSMRMAQLRAPALLTIGHVCSHLHLYFLIGFLGIRPQRSAFRLLERTTVTVLGSTVYYSCSQVGCGSSTRCTEPIINISAQLSADHGCKQS